MKKNMIALAVAGAMIAPAAMAEVSVSGGLQAELVRIGGNAPSNNGFYAADAWEKGTESSGNYGFLKFSASEDLGGGMKALAVYNFNVNVGDAGTAKGGLYNTTPGGREAYVGLSGGFGTVLAGTLNTPYKSSTVGWDPMLATTFQARGNYGMFGALHNGYASNALAYANSFAGGMVKLVAAVVVDEAANKTSADKTQGKHGKSLSLNIAPMSGLDVAIAYINVSEMGKLDDTGATTGYYAKDAAATKVGAKYSMGAITVAAQVEMLDKGLTASGKKGNVTYLTGTFKVDDANSVSLSYGQQDKKVNDAAEKDGATYAAIAFKHAFSKNTSAYVGYRDSKDKSAGGTEEKAAGVGLRVAF